MSPARRIAWAVFFLFVAGMGVQAQESKPDYRPPVGVTFRTADIISEGTRMSAEIFAPEGPEDKKLPTIIIAGSEELYFNRDHAILAYERSAGVKKLVTIPDIKHYGIYAEARDRAEKEAIAWYDEHLKQGKP